MEPVTPIELIARRVGFLNQRFKPHNGQKKILEQIFKYGKRRVFLECGRSFGKTAICNYVAARIACVPGTSSFIIGPTKKQQDEICWENEQEGIKSFFREEDVKAKETESRISTKWGSFIKIDGSEMYKAYRGTAYDLMIIDEAAYIDWRFYEASYYNLSKRNGILIVISSTPDTEDHPFLQLKRSIISDPDWVYLKATSWENPTPAIQDWLKREYPKYVLRGEIAEWKREVECEFVPGGKRSIFPMFSRNKHVLPHATLMEYLRRDAHHLQYGISADPGTNSVTAIGFYAHNPHTGELFKLDEIYETERLKNTVNQLIPQVISKQTELFHKFSTPLFVYDEAAAWFAAEVGSQFQIGLEPSQKSRGDKMEQLSMMKDAFLAGKFKFSDRCENTIREFSNYQTDEHGKIPDKNDHTIDECRYLTQAWNYTSGSTMPLRDFNNLSVATATQSLHTSLEPTDQLVDFTEDDYEGLWT